MEIISTGGSGAVIQPVFYDGYLIIEANFLSMAKQFLQK